jgi:hypothetical protein
MSIPMLIEAPQEEQAHLLGPGNGIESSANTFCATGFGDSLTWTGPAMQEGHSFGFLPLEGILCQSL